MISGHGTIADAVEATRSGAFDFLEKPLSRDKVLLAIKNALEHSSLRRRTSDSANWWAATEDDRLLALPSSVPWNRPAWLRARTRASC